MTRDDVVADARAWLAAPTPFVHQASRKGVGSDCIGLPAGIARDRGTPEGIAWAQDRRFKGYARTPHPRTLLAGVAEYLDQIDIEDARAGDIVLMRFRQDPQHFAIVASVAPAYIIHASSWAGRVVENRLDVVWRSRVVRAYRYRGLA